MTIRDIPYLFKDDEDEEDDEENEGDSDDPDAPSAKRQKTSDVYHSLFHKSLHRMFCLFSCIYFS